MRSLLDACSRRRLICVREAGSPAGEKYRDSTPRTERFCVTETQIANELMHRIRADADAFGGAMPERLAIGWRGYLAGILEWGIIRPSTYDALLALLPEITDDPVVGILRGRE